MRDEQITTGLPGNGVVRKLSRQEMPLLREHLLRLDPESRRDRFNGFADESFIERYAERCCADGTVIVAYIEDGLVTAAAELHPPGVEDDAMPEIAFSVERHVRRKGLGSILFKRLIAEARQKGYASLRITTGAQNDAMRALANKFGAHLTFRHGESTGSINLRKRPVIATLPMFANSADVARAMIGFNREYWKLVLRMYGLGRAA
ncbi:MAG: GNAT family N-acetyltransferase [Rhizobiales bacterium 62-47]|nr:GNAT family N-acetyltransferase [Hyphomicrobiales bacterium]OJY10000.1 MAG: GNAT family N-acetyltransferase [Rhizobiales bacterium 62-47]